MALARRDPAHRRLVASLLLCDPATGGRWLIDATPDVAQMGNTWLPEMTALGAIEPLDAMMQSTPAIVPVRRGSPTPSTPTGPTSPRPTIAKG